MAKVVSQPPESVSCQTQAVSSNVAPALPPCLVVRPCPLTLEHQASITLSHAGGATVVNTAFPTDPGLNPDLTGLQSPLSVMPSASDQTPRIFFSPSDYNLPDFSGPFGAFPPPDSLQGDSQYSLSASTAIHSRYLDVESPSVGIIGVTHHPTSPLDLEPQSTAPWSHLSATEGPTPPFPTNIRTDESEQSRHLSTPNRQRAGSSASGQESVRDSAYWTGSRKSQNEGDSLIDPSAETMDPRPYRSQLFTSGPRISVYPSSHSTIIPGGFSNPPPSESGQSVSPLPRPAQRPARLRCRECDYHAKTRSDLKKHCARHQREHRCTFPACPRQAKGFATSNDLDRHLKSVHDVNNRNTKYFRCFAEGCPRSAKKWPRLDNFKQHLQKMHQKEDQKRLLELSEEWYKQEGNRQERNDETEFNFVSNSMLPAAPVRSVTESYQAYQDIYPDPSQSFNQGIPIDGQMRRSYGFDNQAVDPSLSSSPNPRMGMAQGVQHQRTSSAAGSAGLQRQFPPPAPINTSNLVPPGMMMQRAKSQTIYSQSQDTSHSANSFSPVGDAQPWPTTPWAGIEPPAARNVRSLPAAKRMNNPPRYAFANNQIRRVQGPHTIADPVLDSDRMTEFQSPQEVQSAIPNELGGRPEDYLMNIGVSTAPENSPHQGFKVNIFPPEDEHKPPNTEIGKLLEDEIKTFLDEHALKSDKARIPLSAADIVSRFRMTLRSSFDDRTSVGGSSISRFTGPVDSETPRGKVCPHTKKTYFPCPVKGCNKVKMRPSELKKHMHRHERPFGCTFDRCNKTFGSKNDWKRHEQGQHEQPECWRCSTCHEVLYHSEDNYIDHMRRTHPECRSEDGRYNARRHRIARNYQGQFWCGFCNSIIVHHQHGVDAINIRFNHIADHFIKDKKSHQSWFELGGKGKTKQVLAEEQRHSNLEDGDEGMERTEAESDSSQSSSSSHSDSSPEQQPFSPQSSSAVTSPSDPRQERVETGLNANQLKASQTMMVQQSIIKPWQGQTHHHPSMSTSNKMPAELIICCRCGGPTSFLNKTKTCMDDSCLHEYCPDCEVAIPKFKKKKKKNDESISVARQDMKLIDM
ncbi:uncharacterized protein Z518_09499 [Rhinocladiella mackenziei CBS 650.93]|uniref:C2H2-type domain-containing protein n=1 Tax=Rhinocladiella mackenziei CBS 650.93 TaxID=1442369 RepID=A0A0D2FIB9_9EURO|nr:uncharacterized protein Z518_09499 [Rhinocladiella mackenziei CBS 650.93]KIX01772.1 hypothetical protein Z518_09499 [Rhinocladiella mackenziei CBS 650.93]